MAFRLRSRLAWPEKIKQLYPSIELLRFANSGTEACTSAVRLARTYTGKRKLVMFEGHYHGWRAKAVFNRYHAWPICRPKGLAQRFPAPEA